MTTTNDMEDRFEDAERGLEWLEKLEALQARSASDRAALDVAEYVMTLRAAVTALAGGRSASELARGLSVRRRRNWWRSCGRRGTTTTGIRGSVPRC